MQCPTDGSILTMSERSGIEIDYCPHCRGVWLDRGELDKILDRAASAPAARAATTSTDTATMPAVTWQQHHEQGHRPTATKRRRKGSWLSELFD